jgi:hypothetical protein
VYCILAPDGTTAWQDVWTSCLWHCDFIVADVSPDGLVPTAEFDATATSDVEILLQGMEMYWRKFSGHVLAPACMAFAKACCTVAGSSSHEASVPSGEAHRHPEQLTMLHVVLGLHVAAALLTLIQTVDIPCYGPLSIPGESNADWLDELFSPALARWLGFTGSPTINKHVWGSHAFPDNPRTPKRRPRHFSLLEPRQGGGQRGGG